MNSEKIDELIKELPQLKGLVAKCKRCGEDLEVKIILVCPDKNCKKATKAEMKARE